MSAFPEVPKNTGFTETDFEKAWSYDNDNRAAAIKALIEQAPEGSLAALTREIVRDLLNTPVDSQPGDGWWNPVVAYRAEADSFGPAMAIAKRLAESTSIQGCQTGTERYGEARALLVAVRATISARLRSDDNAKSMD